MKKGYWIMLGAAAALIGMVICHFLWKRKPVVTVTEDPVYIETNGYHPTNQNQFFNGSASVWLGTYDGQLFFYRDDYEPGMYVFENGGVTKLFSGEGEGYIDCRFFCSFDQYVYYHKDKRGNVVPDSHTFCFDMSTREEHKITEEKTQHYRRIYCEEDSSIYVFTGNNDDLYYHIKGDQILGEVPVSPFSVGKYKYRIGKGGGQHLFQIDESGEECEVALSIADSRIFYPLENGLLVYNKGYSTLLEWIDEEGNVIQLFDAGYFRTASTVALSGTDLYVSVYGYGEWDEWDRRMLADDTSGNGIYRISLVDYSIEKVCDRYYSGLYNFDDTCFYACDGAGGIYQLDFEGNEIRTLLKVKTE